MGHKSTSLIKYSGLKQEISLTENIRIWYFRK